MLHAYQGITDFSQLRVAIVHYWFVNRRGGERVIEALADMFPQADIFTLILDRSSLSPRLASHCFTTSFLQNIPGARRHYRKLLPLFPLAVEQFRLDDYDLVLSSESGPAKGVLTPPSTCHICYCHSPMRYLWDMYHTYRSESGLGFLEKAVFTVSAHYVRLWDYVTAARPDQFIANSAYVASRIRKHYRREAVVIHPPVDTSAGYLPQTTDDFYLVVGQLVSYKRVDLAIEACNGLQRKLRIVGDGEQYASLRRLAGPTVEFLGSLPDTDVRDQFARCRALLFPGEEDFGIVPVEAQSFGRPVIAYGRGGALETVLGFSSPTRPASESTGVFFPTQRSSSLEQAIISFEAVESQFSPSFIRERALRFNPERFRKQMGQFISDTLAQHVAGFRRS